MPLPPATKDPGKIYLLPNLFTAGNLIFGFLAVLRIIEGAHERETGQGDWRHLYVTSLLFILSACLCDLLDGRVARIGGRESPFGLEFDSLADIVSFGVAPALLVFKIVLHDLPENIGWIIAVFYLLCGALRLARFNISAIYKLGHGKNGTSNFTGFPIPAAAGLISSLTLFLISNYEHEQEFLLGHAKYGLAVLMVFLSFLMFSQVQYPSFKGLNLRTEFSPLKFLSVVFLLGLTVVYYNVMPAVIFVTYLLYGFFRPLLSRSWRHEIEDDDEDEEVEEK